MSALPGSVTATWLVPLLSVYNGQLRDIEHAVGGSIIVHGLRKRDSDVDGERRGVIAHVRAVVADGAAADDVVAGERNGGVVLRVAGHAVEARDVVDGERGAVEQRLATTDGLLALLE
jgi:hypothetical protein